MCRCVARGLTKLDGLDRPLCDGRMRGPEINEALLAGIPSAGDRDRIEYYRLPFVGRLFRQRINLGLSLLPRRRFGRTLEVGYGAGALQLSLAPFVDELHGI